MATWHVNSDSGNDTTGNGAQGNPYKTLYNLCVTLGVVAANDTVLCTNGIGNVPEVLTAPIQVLNALPTFSAPVKIIGVNSSWVDDGTRYKINGNSAVVNCFANSVVNQILIEVYNLELYNATSACLAIGTTNAYWTWVNCIFRNSAGAGVSGATGSSLHIYYKCRFNNNATFGIQQTSTTSGSFTLICCEFFSNANGIRMTYLQGFLIFGCVIRDNTSSGISMNTVGYGMIPIINNVFDGNAYGVVNAVTGTFSRPILLGNRFTNNTAARFAPWNGSIYLEDLNFSLNNGADTLIGTGIIRSILNRSISSGTEGYVNRAGKNYALTRQASGISIEDAIGGLDGTTKMYWTAGLPRIEPVLPAIDKVETLTQYGDNGTELTGTKPAGAGGGSVIGSSIIRRVK